MNAPTCPVCGTTLRGDACPACAARRAPPANVSDNFVKESTISIDQAGTGGETDPLPGHAASVSDNYLVNSTLRIDQSSHVDNSTKVTFVQDPGAEAERKLRKAISDALLRSSVPDAAAFQALLIAAASSCDVPLVDAIRIGRELYRAHVAQLGEVLEIERTRPNLEVLGPQGQPLFPAAVSINQLVAYLNDHQVLGFAPAVRLGPDSGATRSVWRIPEVIEHPSIRLRCSQTLERIDLAHLVVCDVCGRPFGPGAHLTDGRCSDCSRSRPRLAERTGEGVGRAVSAEDLDETVWARVPAGTFIMGSQDSELDRDDDEAPHAVTISRALWMLRRPVSQGMYESVLGREESGSPVLPASGVSWFDAIGFCNALSKRLGLEECYEITAGIRGLRTVRWKAGGAAVRLPTEAEWEHACRAGTTGPYYAGVTAKELHSIAVFDTEQPEPLGTRQPNGFGLYDMLGSVWEWVWDGRGPYGAGPVTDPTGNGDAIVRVLRGGSFGDEAADCRCAKRFYAGRDNRGDSFGLRVVFDPGAA